MGGHTDGLLESVGSVIPEITEGFFYDFSGNTTTIEKITYDGLRIVSRTRITNAVTFDPIHDGLEEAFNHPTFITDYHI
jgi:hypothetical protein